MEVKDFITSKVWFDDYGGYFWFRSKENGDQMVAEVRGWGNIQNQFETIEEAKQFQYKLGKFIADAINEKLETCKNCEGDK